MRQKREGKIIDIFIPLTLLEQIEKYQSENLYSSRVAAIIELLRIGLKESKKAEK